MDGERIDRLARTVATRMRRRQVVSAVGIGLLALVRNRRSTGMAAAQAGAPEAACRVDADCRPANADPCTGARCTGGRCVIVMVDCVRGFFCCGNGTCCPETPSASEAADADDREAMADLGQLLQLALRWLRRLWPLWP